MADEEQPKEIFETAIEGQLPEKPINEPENFNIEIISKDESLWIKNRDACLGRIEQYESNLIIERAFLETCERKIAEEKAKNPPH